VSRAPALLLVDRTLADAGELTPRVALDLTALATEHDLAVAVGAS
jgi:hypothetical protein